MSESLSVTIDDKNMLIIEIKNNNPVELKDFASSMLAVASEYNNYASRTNPSGGGESVKLYINEIRKGSIIASLAPSLAVALPLMVELTTILSFTEYLIKGFKSLSQSDSISSKLTKKSLKNLSKTVAPVANNTNSQMNIYAVDDSRVVVNNYYMSIDTKKAIDIQRGVDMAIDELDSKGVSGLYENVLMAYTVTTDNHRQRSSDKVVIDQVDPSKALNVVYESESIKQRILGDEDNIFNKIYLVSVEVLTSQGRAVAYRIKELKDIFNKDELL